MNEPQPQKAGLSSALVALFYAALGVVALGLARWLGDLNLAQWHNINQTELYADALLGAVAGLLVVGLSDLMDRYFEWSRALSREFGRTLGALNLRQAFIFALASGVGEEMLFRGFLQQYLSGVVFTGAAGDWLGLTASSLVFGMLHIGPDVRKMLPWTGLAIVLGFAFGLMYLYTGNLLAPIVAHFTINFFNLQTISRRYGHLKEELG